MLRLVTLLWRGSRPKDWIRLGGDYGGGDYGGDYGGGDYGGDDYGSDGDW